jgi:hypothetical protein
LVGVDQVNEQIPTDAPEGCSVPIRVGGGLGTNSQPVTVSIRKGGGPCQDAPLVRVGTLNWTKTITTGPVSPAPVAIDTLQANLIEAPGNLLTPAPSTVGNGISSMYGSTPLTCPGAGGRRLDAGVITAQGGTGAPFTFAPSSASGELLYNATLPPGTLQPGTVHLSAAGGADIGAFQANLSLPSPIQITTPLSPGTAISWTKPFRLDWSGGTPDEVVTVRMVNGSNAYFQGFAAADKGTVTLTPFYLSPSMGYGFPIPPNNPLRIEVLVTPAQQQTFGAPTLSQPGTQNWTYWYKFTGLVWQ